MDKKEQDSQFINQVNKGKVGPSPPPQIVSPVIKPKPLIPTPPVETPSKKEDTQPVDDLITVRESNVTTSKAATKKMLEGQQMVAEGIKEKAEVDKQRAEVASEKALEELGLKEKLQILEDKSEKAKHGSFGAALAGSQNTALTIINKQMEEHSRANENKAANKIKVINQSRLSVEAKKELMKKELLNLQAKKESGIRIVLSKIDNLKAKFGAKGLPLAIQDITANLTTKLGEIQTDNEKDLMTITQETEQKELAKVPDTIKLDAAKSKEQREKDKLYVKGHGYVGDPKQKDLLDISVAGVELTNEVVGEIIEMTKEYGILAKMPFHHRALLKQKINILASKNRIALLGPGVMTEQEFQRLLSMIGDPTRKSEFQSTGLAQLKAFRETVNKFSKHNLKQMIIRPDDRTPQKVPQDGDTTREILIVPSGPHKGKKYFINESGKKELL